MQLTKREVCSSAKTRSLNLYVFTPLVSILICEQTKFSVSLSCILANYFKLQIFKSINKPHMPCSTEQFSNVLTRCLELVISAFIVVGFKIIYKTGSSTNLDIIGLYFFLPVKS